MSSKYDKNIQYSHEEEGSYHKHQVEHLPASSSGKQGGYTEHYQVVSVPAGRSSSRSRHHELATTGATSDEDNFEEWTTSKRKVNHKTRQVETRVSRQLLVEDGKVIADSGPQVTTRIKEDNKVEECEKEKQPKNRSKFEALENAPEGKSSGRVLGEKKEIQRVSREVREENMQYHDERFKELTGHDVHRRAIQAPHELITIHDQKSDAPPRGKMVHYSNRGKKYRDTDEILEVAKLAIDGSITKEVKRTRHHEESSEDEVPDEKGEAEALKEAPTVTRTHRRHFDYVNDFDDTDTPSGSEVEEHTESNAAARRHKSLGKSRSHRPTSRGHQQADHADDEAFPRYQIDPLLNSLNDEDYSRPRESANSRVVRPVRRQEPASDSDSESDRGAHRRHQSYRSPSPRAQPVEIPEEYRVNRQRLLQGERPSRHQHAERSFSPASKSHLSHSSHRSHKSHKEDASVQAHLTDEEEERRSMRSSLSGNNTHEKTTKSLQRQSTARSHRNYYFGEPNKQTTKRNKSPVSVSSSSSSCSDPKERMRKGGVRSRDSGFKSPHMIGRDSPDQQQIYSVSTKAKKPHRQVASPTPTSGSLGQRSVKTTTTTLAAGLTDRPSSRNQLAEVERGGKLNRSASERQTAKVHPIEVKQTGKSVSATRRRRRDEETTTWGQPLDTISLSSLGPNATTIKVPYIGGHREKATNQQSRGQIQYDSTTDVESILEISGSELKLKDDIASLNKRIDDISRRSGNAAPQRYDYRTVVATVQATLPKPQVVDTYNVRVIEHDSPFKQKSISELSNSIARLESLSSELDSKAARNAENNNETNFDLSQLTKSVPANMNTLDYEDDDQDRVSLISSISLKSSRTYDIRAQDDQTNEDPDDEKDFPVERLNAEIAASLEASNNERDEKEPSAWIFDLKDGSSTAIVSPPRPKKPESPKIDSKTEELNRSRGGRSYYLELIERDSKKDVDKARQRPSSIDSLYSRSNSHSTLSGSQGRQSSSGLQPAGQRESARSSLQLSTDAAVESRRSRQIRPANLLDMNSRPIVSGSMSSNLKSADCKPARQLPSGCPSLGNRSKSSSCLASSTRPSKYSIYGGLRRPNDNNKPVPRLSYSRAIGPKSQRQLDAQPKMPSRYLKMR